MTVRTIIAAAAVAVGTAAFAAPASARPVRTFDAWNHTFDVPGSQATLEAARDTVGSTTNSIAPRHAYALAGAGGVRDESKGVNAPAIRTINVWGARIDAPTY